MIEEIKKHIAQWESRDKPKNDAEFIRLFTEYAKESKTDQWSFSGENHYSGYTATLSECGHYAWFSGINFEFAYCNEFVKVFNGNHNGYWVPEYIDLYGSEAEELLTIIKAKLLEWACF